MNRSEEMSKLRRVSSGKARSRWNMVGTMWEWVIRWDSISARHWSGVHCSISTMPTPKARGRQHGEGQGRGVVEGAGAQVDVIASST
jgi:hypothetical protein